MSYEYTILWLSQIAPAGSRDERARWIANSLQSMRHWDALEQHLVKWLEPKEVGDPA